MCVCVMGCVVCMCVMVCGVMMYVCVCARTRVCNVVGGGGGDRWEHW